MPKKILIRVLIGLFIVGGVLSIAIINLLPDGGEDNLSMASYSKGVVIKTDHSNMISGNFEDGPSVTRKCLECHPDAGKEMTLTQHWKWLGEEVKIAGRDEPVTIGKRNLINNFCISIKDNYSKCTACHAGYGWKDKNFDFSNQENVDCLVCHEHSGQYLKGDYGYPAKGADLLAAARSVTIPGRNNCGACHFSGGGGNGVKHGDLDGSLIYPSERIDVHMGRLDFVCVDCHKTKKHKISGRSMSVSVDDENRLLCDDCHAKNLHKDERINAHTGTVACQTCHIPYFALDDPTKMTWDWSTAGLDNDIKDKHKYMKIKGSFTYEKNVVPEYYWYNGQSYRYLTGDKINPDVVTSINHPYGDIRDKNAKIYPFKTHTGKQPYDKVHNYLLTPTTAGEGGFWREFDWNKALKLGAEAVGLQYSGQYDFAPTAMFWKTSHMVATKEKALQCVECHSDNGRMDWEKLGYTGDPMKIGDRKFQGLIRASQNKGDK